MLRLRLLAIAIVTAHGQAFGSTESILWNFKQSGTDGENPFAGPIIDTSGNLYGTTRAGYGTVFEISNIGG